MFSGGQNRDDREITLLPGANTRGRVRRKAGSTYSKARIALCRIYSDTCSQLLVLSAYSIRGGGSYA